VTPRRLAGVQELHALAPLDPYVAQLDDDRVSSAWSGDDGAVAWVVGSRRVPGRGHAITLGPVGAAVDLLVGLLAELGGELGSASVPQGAARLLPPTYALQPANDWEWFATSTPPPPQAGEDRVGWLDDTDPITATEIVELLRGHSGRHDAEPGQEQVRRWGGVRDGDERLVAVAAHTEFWHGVPFLASVATRTDARGHGLGAATTAWITRRLLAERAPRVTLGMYSDNAVARRIYQRLGFTCHHAFTSGRLVRRGPTGTA
jgi:GNAT superfamily N-acetyltransferase